MQNLQTFKRIGVLMGEERDLIVKNKGKITCNRSILLSIINLATKEICGVSGLTSSLQETTMKAFQSGSTQMVRCQLMFISEFIMGIACQTSLIKFKRTSKTVSLLWLI